MTIEQAAAIIYEEAARHGEPLTLDVARHIAVRLLVSEIYGTNLKLGEIARKHRNRYED